MDLYFAPLSCSMATRISLYELGISAGYHEVTLSTKRLKASGDDYLAINPKGQVPALRTDEGRILTEGPAVLQYVADQDATHRLAPPSGDPDRYVLQQWLNYISTEIHKAIYYTVFNPESPPEARDFARSVLLPKAYGFLNAHLKDRDVLLLDRFTVADAYLVTTLIWAIAAGVDLSPWPALAVYRERHMARPAVARAFEEERPLRASA